MQAFMYRGYAGRPDPGPKPWGEHYDGLDLEFGGPSAVAAYYEMCDDGELRLLYDHILTPEQGFALQKRKEMARKYYETV
jgi:hypothetical protein